MEVSGKLHAPAGLSLSQVPSILIRYEAIWAPEPVLMLWSREKFLASAGNQTPILQPVDMIARRSGKENIME
jgi:hypothetical protein